MATLGLQNRTWTAHMRTDRLGSDQTEEKDQGTASKLELVGC